MLELPTFGTNYDHQTADKASTVCTKVALWYFCPFPAKRRLEMIDTLVFFSENLTLQTAKAQMSSGLETGGFGGHCAVEITFLTHSWLTCAECGGAESC